MARRQASGRGYGALGFGADPHRDPQPAVGIGGRLRSASEGPPLPGSPLSRPDPPSARERGSDRSRVKSGGTPPPASGSLSSMELAEANRPSRPLDVAGRALGLPPRPAASAPEEKEAPSRAPEAEGEEVKSLPVVEGQNLLNGLGKDAAPDVTRRPKARGRTSRKRQPKAERDADRPVQLQVEASGLRREVPADDSQGSGSEREHASSS
ncbi:unnamed protein product, partial [Effrenium voratum]